MTVTPTMPSTSWFKSSYSGGRTDCVEVAWLNDHRIGVRDSKNTTGPALVFAPDAWHAFITRTRDGSLRQS